ncbi:secretory phospholipase A2 receptor-like [Siniperca chuatsi]|uniref:secretory phospholipase A2 receptor-like n=1 Tax=Siniperca chuatsi TaxID=119488 RepID=UPI001CE0C737|nr:secretory phospholipase A2 receptor-like [Siniperca chuatsi]
MNMTTTVKMTLVLFLLCSGFFHFAFASNRLRFFHLRGLQKYWNSSLNACNQENESFVTLYDEDDADFTANFPGLQKTAWLGLHWVGDRNTTWSDGVPITFNKSSVHVTNGEQICEAIHINTWKGFNCSERKPFMCYKGNNYTLIENKKNWCQALQYCRKYFTDMVSISNDTQNNKVIQTGKNTSFWIGLLHDEWEWTDKSCSSFREWCDPSYLESKDDKQCTIFSKSLHRLNCKNDKLSFCSKGIVRIKVIEQPLTWEQAFDYCKAKHTGLLWIEDEEDQKAVEQWLNHTMVNGSFWIGLRQSRVFGFWIWTSDRTVNYSNWKNGKQPEMPLSNYCGVIEKEDYRWRDENCWLQLPFLCEEEIVFMN